MSEHLLEGTVSYEDGDKAADKADQFDVSRRVRVELKFQVLDGEEDVAVLEQVGDMAKAEVRRLLSGAVPSQGVAEQPKRTRRTKEQIAADKAAEEAAKNPPAGDTDFDPTAEEPAAQDAKGNPVSETDFDPTAEEPATATEVEEDWATEPTTEITDADLNAAVGKKNAEIGDPKAIRGLIAKYNPDPTKQFQLREIKQEQRQDFLTKLAALTKSS